MVKLLFTGMAASIAVVYVTFATRTMADPPTVAASVATQLGISPEALAAAGFSSSDTSALLARLEAQAETIALFLGGQNDLNAAIGQLDAAMVALDSDPDDSTALADKASATTTIGTSSTVVDAARVSLMTAAVAGVDSGPTARLERFRLSAGSAIPLPLRVVGINGAKIRELEAALTAERRADALGESLPIATAIFLSECRGSGDVATATLGLASNLVSIRQVFDAWDHP